MLSRGLQSAEQQQLAVILQDSRALMAELDRVLYNMFLVREKVSELSARIDWLHDDFTTELNSLVQDFTWQQGTLLDQIEAKNGDAAQYLKRAREVQNEQQQVYTLARIENQIVDDLRDRLNELKSGSDDGMLVENHIRYLENLKKTADENIRTLDDWPSTITLRQTIDELLEIGMSPRKKRSLMLTMPERQRSGAFEHCLRRSWGVAISKCRCLTSGWNKLFASAVDLFCWRRCWRYFSPGGSTITLFVRVW